MRHHFNRRLQAVSLSCLVIAAACSDSATTEPGANQAFLTADLATASADAVGEEIEMMGGPGGRFNIGLFGAFSGPFGAFAARDLGCRSLNNPALQVVRTCTFQDANGAVQDTYDPLTTAQARIQTSVSAERSRENFEASFTRTTDHTASGLAGTETTRTWNGTGTEIVTNSRHTEAQGTRAYTLSTNTSTNNVVVPVGQQPGWPLSGSITRVITGEITAGPNAGQTFSRTVTVTFNGTSTVTMTVGDETFTVDLQNRRANRRDG